ncbi:hypothetical protein, partial [Klebsiella pneumoniae]|uniref:hypothetical protein n=1 Tax=Klebsiella pneumoniae TaxID=573 RepID=UPI0038525719
IMPSFRDLRFQVTGGFTLDESLIAEEVLSADGEIVGFKLLDGRTVKLIVGLEVESADEVNYDYITSEKEMQALGFSALEYDR